MDSSATPKATPKALIHKKYGVKAVYKTEEVPDARENQCPGLAVQRRAPARFRCQLALPDLEVVTGSFARKKDAEQAAAQLAVDKLGLQEYEKNLTPDEAFNELIKRLNILFTDEFLTSLHPLVGHLKSSLRQNGTANLSSVPISAIPTCDTKVNNLCKTLNPNCETDLLLTLSLIFKAVRASDSLSSSSSGLSVWNKNPYQNETLLSCQADASESVQVRVLEIPCELEEGVKGLRIDLKSDGYYLDEIAKVLGVDNPSHVIISRVVGKTSSEMRFYFAAPQFLLSSPSDYNSRADSDAGVNKRATYLSGQTIYGNAIMANLGFTWRSTSLFCEDVSVCTYHRMLLSRLPDGPHRLSLNSLLVSCLPNSYSRASWRGSPPKDLLSAFCRAHRLSEPLFSVRKLTEIEEPQTGDVQSDLKRNREERLTGDNKEEPRTGDLQCELKILTRNKEEPQTGDNKEEPQTGDLQCELKVLISNKEEPQTGDLQCERNKEGTQKGDLLRCERNKEEAQTGYLLGCERNKEEAQTGDLLGCERNKEEPQTGDLLRCERNKEEAQTGDLLGCERNREETQTGDLQCELKILTRNKEETLVVCPFGEVYKRECDAVQGSALRVLQWFKGFFAQLDWSSPVEKTDDLRIYPCIILQEFGTWRDLYGKSFFEVKTQKSDEITQDFDCETQKCDEITRNGVGLMSVEGNDSGVFSSNGSLVGISYEVYLVKESGDSNLRHLVERNEEFEFEIGTGSVIPQVESCITQISVDQSAKFTSKLPSKDLIMAASDVSHLSLDGCLLEYNVKLIRVTEPMEERMEKAFFSPPLSKQRVLFAVNQINQSNAFSLVDFGCGSGSLLDSLLDHNTCLKQVVGVDISVRALTRAAKVLHQKLSKNCAMQACLKSAVLYDGSITDFDARLYNLDIATCLEVIEHMEEDQAHLFGDIALSLFSPKILIVSTPNYEYNPILQRSNKESEDSSEEKEKIPCKFRNFDHKFEWTRAQFELWANNLASKHNYHVEFSGVGGSGEIEPGFASQIAVFKRNLGELRELEGNELQGLESGKKFEVVWEWEGNDKKEE